MVGLTYKGKCFIGGIGMLFGVITGLAAAGAAAICGGAGGFEDLAWLWMLPVFFAGLWILLTVGALAFLVIAVNRVDQNIPQEQDSPFYRRLAKYYVAFIKTLLRLRVDTKGLEKTPKEGRFLLVCNHLDDSDPAVLLHYLRDSQLAFISKRENRDMYIVGKLMHKLQCQLVNRENDREALKCILKCIEILKNDRASIAVFPEGYESKDGRLLPFRPGVFKIAQKAQVPIVVCTLQGSEGVIRNLKKLKPLPRVQLHLLEVIPAEELAGKTTVEIAHRVRSIMLSDLAEKYQPVNE